MKTLPLLAAIVLLVPIARGAETFDEAMKRAAAEYNEKSLKAAEELSGARKRIADEKAPILLQMRGAEDRIVEAQSQTEILETGREGATEARRKLLLDLDAIHKNAAYMNSLAHDGLKAYEDGLAPGEGQLVSARLGALDSGLEDPASGSSAKAAVEIAEFLLERTRRALGGYAEPGSSLVAGSNRLRKGTFAFAGPETFFLPDDGGLGGSVRTREGLAYPVSYELGDWKAGDASAFFRGQLAAVPADPSGGKSLRMKETTGTVLEHIQKGGVVAYAIIAVGVLALVMMAQKVRDVSRLSVDPTPAVRSFLELVARGEHSRAERELATLGGSTREMFAVGLRNIGLPKAILEEHLQSELLRQRLHYERRLPLLIVIATAAPLMGLLGTVVGMVKTFALITVFGTGNAGKLASGISQVLVTTELGLIVAIPTLIGHGFLANRTQKKLSLLERQALDFVIAAETAKGEREAART